MWKLEYYFLSLKHVRARSRYNATGFYQYSNSKALHYWQTSIYIIIKLTNLMPFEQ